MSIVRPIKRPIVRGIVRSIVGDDLFSISNLFAGDDEGFYLDGSVNQNHYIEGTGSTLAGKEDVIGLALDRSKNALGNLGQQLIPSNLFNSSTGWTLDPGWEITGGQLVGMNVDVGNDATTDFISETKKFYKLNVNVESVDGRVRLLINNSRVTNSYDSNADPSLREPVVFISTGESNNTFFFRVGGNGQSATIDSVSLKEIPGNHFHQPTTPSRPRRELGPDGNWFYRFDGSDDYLEAPAAHFEPPFTLAGVLAVDGSSNDQIFLGGHDSGVSGHAGEIFYQHSTGNIGMYNGSSLAVTLGQHPVSPVVVVAVFDGVNSELHVGDAVVTGNAGGRSVSAGTFAMGAKGPNQDANFFDGRVWQPFGVNRRLSISEIQNLKSKLRSRSPA